MGLDVFKGSNCPISPLWRKVKFVYFYESIYILYLNNAMNPDTTSIVTS